MDAYPLASAAAWSLLGTVREVEALLLLTCTAQHTLLVTINHAVAHHAMRNEAHSVWWFTSSIIQKISVLAMSDTVQVGRTGKTCLWP